MAICVKILASASLPCHPNSLWQAFAKVKRNYPLYALKIILKSHLNCYCKVFLYFNFSGALSVYATIYAVQTDELNNYYQFSPMLR